MVEVYLLHQSCWCRSDVIDGQCLCIFAPKQSCEYGLMERRWTSASSAKAACWSRGQNLRLTASQVSTGVCYGGKGWLHFINEKAKVNAKYYVESLFPTLVADCNRLLLGGYIFQQDGAHAHTARLTQTLDCHQLSRVHQYGRPPNSTDLNPLDYHVWGAMLGLFQKYQPVHGLDRQLFFTYIFTL